MKPAVVAFLTCLLVLSAQGQLSGRSSGCKCYKYLTTVNRLILKAGQDAVVHNPNIFCTKTEIIITIANKEKCVNPETPFGQWILKNKSRDTGKISTSTQTNSSTTRRLHSTAKPKLRP